LFAAAVSLALWVRTPQALLHSASERWLNWQVAWAAFADAPLTGVGLGRFAAAYATLRPPGSNITRYAHNAPVQALAEGGVAWAALFSAGAVVVLLACWRRRASLRPEQVVWLGAALAILVRLLLDYDLQIPQTAALASLAVGLAVGGLLRAGTTELARAPAWAARAAVLVALSVLAVPTLLLARDNARADDDERAAWLLRFPSDADTALLHVAEAHRAARACTDSCDALIARAHDRAHSLAHSDAPTGARAVAWVLLAEQALWRGDAASAAAHAEAALQLEAGLRDAHRVAVQAARAAGVDEESARTRARRYHSEAAMQGW
jgi:hypothetical protein